MWWMRWTAKSGSLGGPGASEPMRGCSTRVGACQAEAPISCKFYDGRIFLRSVWGHLFQNVPLVCQRPSKTSPQCVCAVAGRFMPLSRQPTFERRAWEALEWHLGYAYGCLWLERYQLKMTWMNLQFFDLPDKRFLCFFALAIVFQFFLFHSLMPGITLKVDSSIVYSKITSIDACIGTWFWNSKIDHTYSCETHAPPLEIYFHAHALHQWTSVDMTRPIQICERLFVKSKLAGFASWMKMGKGLNIHCDDQCQLMLGFNDFSVMVVQRPGKQISNTWHCKHASSGALCKFQVVVSSDGQMPCKCPIGSLISFDGIWLAEREKRFRC